MKNYISTSILIAVTALLPILTFANITGQFPQIFAQALVTPPTPPISPRPTPLPTITITPTPSIPPTPPTPPNPTPTPTPTPPPADYLPRITVINLPDKALGRQYNGYVEGEDLDTGDTLTMSFYGLPPGLIKKTCGQIIRDNKKIIRCTIVGNPILLGIYQVSIHISDGVGGMISNHTITIK